MVRKPENMVPPPLQQAVNHPPYPLTPTEDHAPELPASSHSAEHAPLTTPPGFHEITHEEADPSGSNSDAESINTDWDSGDDEEEEEEKKPGDLPAPLKVGGGKPQAEKTQPDSNGLPETLRVGPPAGARPRPPIPAGIDEPRQTVPMQSQNPYLNMQKTGQSSSGTSYGAEDTTAIWGGRPQQQHVQTDQEPVELPSERTPVDELSKMSLRDDAVPAPTPKSPAVEQPGLVPEEAKPVAERHGSDASSAWDPGMDLSSLDAFTSRGHGLPSPREIDAPKSLTWQEQQSHERSERERREREAADAQERAMQAERERLAEEEWHRGEQAAREAAQVAPEPEEQAPELPPRKSVEAENPPPQPPRPYVDVARAAATSSGRDVESPRTEKQKKEHYSIKHIRWYDSKAGTLTEAHILTQNANGPCPLLALVNALVLSTPYGEQTALMETLRIREQVSLGLLLDAVFDELMSERRAGAAQELPDVGELYAFLLALHTGMNVNPRFVAEPRNLVDVEPAGRNPLRNSDRAGGFEQTREMQLYSTFNIPLIHGWLPPSESRAYAAFDKVAKTYEDAQNMQFYEEEMETKLSTQGLSVEEQKLYEDLHVIKAFFQTWPTQLTEHGLGAISQSLMPGSFAILFRNDHFSTIYKEPRSQKILTLVTDAGYSSHEEIVWESLVDINGMNSELYSGDFRPVSHNLESTPQGLPEPPIRSLLDDNDQGWTTVDNRGGRRNNRGNNNSGMVTGSGVTQAQQTGVIPASEPNAGPEATRTEQEDADLALALQLQEEEEERHRQNQESERRRRENEASQSFLQNEQQSNPTQQRGRSSQSQNQRGPPIPPRRNNVQTHRPAASNEEAPPPTYDEAASGPAFQPPPGHPSSPTAPVRQDSAFSANSNATSQRGRGRGGRRTSQPTPLVNRIPDGSGLRGGYMGRGSGGRRQSSAQLPGQAQGQQREEKCVVM